MKLLPPYATLLSAALLSISLSAPANAGQSLEQIRYALFKDPAAPVEADLRLLAERDDRAAQHLLGNVLASDPAKTREAVQVYQSAFDDGRGDIAALGSLARLLDRTPRLRLEHAAYVREALQQFAHERDVRSLNTSLEVFVAYPELFTPQQTNTLIELYDRSCLLQCSSDLYRAVLAERLQRFDEAKTWYERAMMTDVRAVDRYYTLLGEQQDPLFAAFARSRVGEINRMPVEIVHRIGTQLDSISAERSVGLRYPLPPSQAELDQLPEAQRDLRREQIDQVRTEIENESKTLRGDALIWLDNAVSRGWVPAMVAKVNFMTSSPTENSAEDTAALIDRIAESEPTRAKALRVSLHLVTSWTTLDPYKAQALIDELAEAQYRDATLLQGDLYSHGGLDEPDQQKALGIYEGLAAGGSSTAYYRMASVYSSARAICYDPVKAYAYARVAVDYGDSRARNLVRELQRTMPHGDIEKALLVHATLLKDAPQ
ncbi:MAG: sel1 repeat family protein [Gammaproteobacteria bacterium]|nr:sel1 repeat family protein [Gammaproteobacteria bacterium]MBU1492133.1 sel1 repeat family protein [Gammaproteobacteria bacterium]MBU2067321.1 sel1 repeat family protein [Gammaproteobacteria bacterium]MBU2158463.1 sel1 repeat family protein [Gammaproteobacteria bacterium]MBU2216846.1 sel1 repeat family protein [Gammaproteobacteria bacterium]